MSMQATLAEAPAEQSMDAGKVHETMIEKDPDKTVENLPEQMHNNKKIKENEMKTEGTQQLNTDEVHGKGPKIKVAGNESSQKKEIGEADFQEAFNELWEVEKVELFALASEDVRLQRLKEAWLKRPKGMNVKRFKNLDPLWNKPLRLWPSKNLNSYKRKVLHLWAEKHDIDCTTYYPG